MGYLFALLMIVIMVSFAPKILEFHTQGRKPRKVKMSLQTFAATAGKGAVIKLGTATILGLNDAKISINGETIDTTTFASGGWLEKIQGLKSAELSIAGFFLSDDTTGQTQLRTNFLAGSANVMHALLDGTTGWTGSFIITKWEDGATVAGEVSRSMSMESTGAITVE